MICVFELRNLTDAYLEDTKSVISLVPLSYPHISSAVKPVACNICGKEIAGSRYAPHLERCMNGGKRGAKRYDFLTDDLRAKTKKDFVDPCPQSMVVKIKFRQGGEL
jgi:hypothetical protein